MGQSPVDRLGWAKSFARRSGGPGELVWELEEWLRAAQESSGEEAVPRVGEVHRDLELAKEFQQAYLNRPYPRIPQVHVEGRLRLAFYHRYEPALALGGDFFDIVTLAPDCAGVFIADVMGHGTRSALITAILRTLIGDLQHQGRNAPHFLTELNKQFCEMLRTIPNPLFASACYFVPDTTARVATFSSAGHPSPFIVRSYLQRVSRLNVPPPHGSALGLIDSEKYTGGHVRLNPGDVFLFFTDGVYEAHNAAGEEFGISRIEGILNKLIYKGGKAIVDGIMEAVKEFAGDEPVMDDICMVSVEVSEKAMASETLHGTSIPPAGIGPDSA
jgi:sigma-B regulation protein RsbU (phosphoserine phosphatase)